MDLSKTNQQRINGLVFIFYLVLKLKNYNFLKKRIKKNEGYRESPYLDKLGFATIGYGHLIKNNEKNIYNKKCNTGLLNKLFNLDFNKALNQYNTKYKNQNYSKNIEEVLIEMIFQLGIKRQKKFIKMNNYIKKKELYMACFEMKNSLWYQQTPKRVDGLINTLLKDIDEKKR